MKTALIGIAYAAILLVSWRIQEFDLLLGHTIGVVSLLGLTFFLADHLARKMK
jgi:hypothetical protein